MENDFGAQSEIREGWVDITDSDIEDQGWDG